ncbi:DKNYY domain-containing protein [Dysgonomonas sp. 520]|uniref:DKNYY domain-containing protein n=1 Tax=Dysgonomonas sp. 520 TaxID=2302931 RepID=UPI0013D2C359|nr:DKNYY domain-containing protein [Dysgonomonas sp. 520]NDW10806.1 hypothetical protein [Dysgonomonas sp. 520]
MNRNRKILIIIIGILIAFVPMIALFIVLEIPKKPYREMEKSSRYFMYENEVYFLDNRHKKIRGADIESFVILENRAKRIGLYDHRVGAKDKNHVYFENKVIEGLDPSSVEYIGRKYFKDKNSVYFETQKIERADPNTFNLIAINYYYASDKSHLYYEGKLLEGADLNTIAPVFYRNEDRKNELYLKDKSRVYFRGKVLPKANPETFFSIRLESNQWDIEYGTDGIYYYFEDELVSEDKITMLVADRGFSNHEIFYEGKQLYYYDIKDRELKPFFKRKTDSPIEEIARGLYRDSEHVYFLSEQWDWGNGRKNRALKGKRTKMIRLEDVNPVEFRYVKEFKYKEKRGGERRGSIYEAGGKEYYHPDYPQFEAERKGGIAYSLYRFESGSMSDLSTKDSEEIYTRVSNTSLYWTVFVGALIIIGILLKVGGQKKMTDFFEKKGYKK